jgi:hypothetical protein
MNISITQFNKTVGQIKDLTATIRQIDILTTNLIDLTDLYRSQVVLIVSSLDHFIHEFVLEEMLQIYNGRRTPTTSYNTFSIPVSSVEHGKPSDAYIASYIRQKHSWLSFQEPDKIADAIRLISTKKVWEQVSGHFHLTAGDLKSKLKLVVDRRNKIAHESDMDPSYPDRKWPIDIDIVNEIVDFIEQLVNEIYVKMK